MIKSTNKLFSSVTILPGELFVGTNPTEIITVLGSCVSVTIFCTRTKQGAMCHGIMPLAPTDQSKNIHKNEFRFVDLAVAFMVKSLIKLGGTSATMETKIFGGADMFDVAQPEFSVGKKNIATALAVLAEHGMKKPIANDVGNTHGRKIIFYSHTGKVLLKRLRRVTAEFPTLPTF